MTEAPSIPPKRTTRDPTVTIARILDAARVEFTKHGFDGAKVEHIARRANVSKQLIYLYFKGKDEMYWELLKEMSINISQRLLEIDFEKFEPQDAMRKYFETVYDLFAEDPMIGVVALDQSLHDGAQLRSINEIRQLQKMLKDELRKFVKRGREHGIFHDEVTEDTVEFMAVIVTVGCQSSASMLERYSGRSWQESPEQTRSFAIDFMMRALRP